jgi:signal transduction histidine kinase
VQGFTRPAAPSAGRPVDAGTSRERALAGLVGGLLEEDRLEPALDQWADGASRLLDAAAVTLWTCARDRLIARRARPGPSPSDLSFDDPDAPAARAVRERRVVASYDEGLPTLAAPLFGRGGRMLGVVSCRAVAAPADHDRWAGTVETLAALAAGVVEKAELVARLERQQSDLRDAHQLKANFVATMSHELRTPLNVILGYTDLLADEAFGPLPTDQLDVVRRVQTSARELFELVTATLELSRLEAGDSPLALERVPLDGLAEELRRDTEARASDPAVELDWDVSGLPTIDTDRGKLASVLRSLLANAIKFTPRGRITVRARVEPSTVVFAIADTGIGIAADDVGVIFDMFRQLEPPDTRRFGGVGLGLYVVRQVMEQLGGEVQVWSALGVGSCFLVHLPLHPPEA